VRETIEFRCSTKTKNRENFKNHFSFSTEVFLENLMERKFYGDLRRDNIYELEETDLFYATNFEEESIKRNKFSSKPRTDRH